MPYESTPEFAMVVVSRKKFSWLRLLKSSFFDDKQFLTMLLKLTQVSTGGSFSPANLSLSAFSNFFL
jgi:hypothetical protein